MSTTDSIHKKVVVIGHVDHGKSTLLGRVLLDCGRVPEDKVESVRKTCRDRGIQFEPAFLFDALKEEQEQGISIDSTRVFFEHAGLVFTLIDVPGHLEFLKNMTSGASEAEIAILVVDCVSGVRSQTRRHLRILSMLGVKSVIVAVNKIDEAKYNQAAFDETIDAVKKLIEEVQIECLSCVPISALTGENLVTRGDNLPWYKDKTLLEVLTDWAKQEAETIDFSVEPFRMLLQDVYRFEKDRLFAGRIISGEIKPETEIIFLPSGKMSRVEHIRKYPQARLDNAAKGESVALTLHEQIFVERGEVLVQQGDRLEVDTEFRSRLVWFVQEPFVPGGEYLLKLGTAQVKCSIEAIFEQGNQEIEEGNIKNGTIFDAIIRTAAPVVFERGGSITPLNRFVLCSTFETVAAGMIDPRPVERAKQLSTADANLTHESGYVSRQEFEQLNEHRGTVLWLTGLSGAGKSTLAKGLEKTLFSQGLRATVLDGDNLRLGLCSDLRFSQSDRAENIRRTAHVAKLFLDKGFITIVACISPYVADREVARRIIGSQDMHEIFMFCPIEECQRRDPKGLYKKASSGAVSKVTGLDSPYQPPLNPALRLDSSRMSVTEEIDAVLQLLS
ncbi:MAG TPA: adenylyl-sulfate kinase, partial [Candidatus Obscuribacterales bacterium]